jgi:aspartyl-tRNA(Asn)/glutamyl-tRNA(Gln) amidotransferase subunit A
VRSKLIEDFDKAFSKVDAIIAPVSPTPPFRIGEKNDDPLQMYLSDIFTVSANLAGIPSLSVPAGFTKSGLPVGFQLMGPRFSEQSLYTLGKLYQSRTDWHLKEPKL